LNVIGGKPEMPTAFVLLNTELGSEQDVLNSLRHTDGVQEAYRLMGLYNVIARVQADSTDELTQIISRKLSSSNVHKKQTIIVTESLVKY
jgi:DNA-binding Lrp family transcriptional regulator